MARPRGSTGTKQLTVDQRIRVRTLFFDAHLTKTQIYATTGFSFDQVRTAIRAPEATVSKRTGRPRKLTAEQEEELVEFVCASKENRRMSFLQLSTVLFEGAFGEWRLRRRCIVLGSVAVLPVESLRSPKPTADADSPRPKNM